MAGAVIIGAEVVGLHMLHVAVQRAYLPQEVQRQIEVAFGIALPPTMPVGR